MSHLWSRRAGSESLWVCSRCDCMTLSDFDVMPDPDEPTILRVDGKIAEVTCDERVAAKVMKS